MFFLKIGSTFPVQVHSKGELEKLLNNYFENESLREYLAVIRRLYELRRARKIGVVLVECGQIYIAAEEIDPWGTKVALSLKAARELCDRLESFERKNVQSETRVGTKYQRSA